MGFLQLRHQYQISHEVQRGAQRASRVVLGMSGLRACGEGECVIALESWEGLGPQEAFKKDSQGLSWVGAGNTRFHRPLRGP